MLGLPSHPHSPSQYITSRTQLPSAALGAPPLTRETENSPRSVGMEPSPPPKLQLSHTLLPTQPHPVTLLAPPSLLNNHSGQVGPRTQM